MKIKKLMLILGTIGVVLTILTGIVIYKVYKFPSMKKIPQTEQDIIEDCKDLDVIETANCLRDNVATFYYYNDSNLNVPLKDMDFEKLKNEGGVCRHFSKFYEKWAVELGFIAKHITQLPEVAHGYSQIIDPIENDYCILDQNNLVGCMDLKSSQIGNEVDYA